MFGIDQAWTGEEEVTVQLSQRMILGPLAAKRLALLLGNVIAQYEERFGALDPVAPAAASTKS